MAARAMMRQWALGLVALCLISCATLAQAQSPLTLKGVVDWNGVNQQWRYNAKTGYGLLVPTHLRETSTLPIGGYFNNGFDVMFTATRDGPLSFHGNIWYVTGIDPTVNNATADVRVWKNGGTSGDPCTGDGLPPVFGIANSGGSLLADGQAWVFAMPVAAEEAWATKGATYRVCMAAPLIGGSGYVDGLHSWFSFNEEP